MTRISFIIAACLILGRSSQAELASQAGQTAGGSQPTSTVSAQGDSIELAAKAILQGMQQSAAGLDGYDAGQQTQAVQLHVVSALKGLIQRAGQGGREVPGRPTPTSPTTAPPSGSPPAATPPQSSPSEGGTPSGKPGQAAATASATSGTTRAMSAAQVRGAMRNAWGELPAKARQQLLQQAAVEEFLPPYESMLEEYFQRLAQPRKERR